MQEFLCQRLLPQLSHKPHRRLCGMEWGPIVQADGMHFQFYSAHGPILPIGSEVLALTAMAAFRPRRWRGAVLPKAAKVRFEVIEPVKRPVMADADNCSVKNVMSVEIESAGDVAHRLLFDADHGLEERLIREQFA